MLRRRSAWTWIGAVAAVGIAIVTAVAAVDHVRKAHAVGHASLAEWYCVHRGHQCGGRRAADIEGAWNARERVYKALDVGLFVVAVVAVIAVRPRRE